MRRGFKAQAERKSAELRSELSLSGTAPIDPWKLLQGRGIVVWSPEDVPGFGGQSLLQLVEIDADAWSGVTIRCDGQIAIIINSTHPLGRQANTLMHEWAHVELRHKPNRVDTSGDGFLLLSDYPPEHEEEADWLAGAALLPRDALLRSRSSGQPIEQIATNYGVSLELVQWRLRMTGVDRQLRYAR